MDWLKLPIIIAAPLAPAASRRPYPPLRLVKLKLAGFKSFVDPTSVLFPGMLSGIVGPNGCGKSNVIDAVRWVLGESKASELRGESIQDVIFKGSGGRKEVSRASVELIFDNSLGRAAGQWSQYSEITVKRVLDRAGNSAYYINNLHVRRRDVIDLFLGTGLGPRAYAIIGQGMISRIIEARPEDLRMFLEEAAGVTKYKERRRETAHRLEDASENLARVDDIRNELEGQIGRLAAQAEVAREYHRLNEQLVRQQGMLWLKKRNDARDEARQLSAEIEQAALRIDSETAALRTIEARVEEARQQHFAASDALHAAQAEMYAATSEVRRLEGEIVHRRERRGRLEARLAQLATERAHWQAESARLAAEAERWNMLIEQAGFRLQTANARHEEVLQRLPVIEDEVSSVGAAVLEARRQLAEAEQGLRLAQADHAHAQRSLDALHQRRARLEEERSRLVAPDALRLAAAQEAEEQAALVLALAQQTVDEGQALQPALETALRGAQEVLRATQAQLTGARARLTALEQLQARVKPVGEIGAWLRARGLENATPLWRAIEVEPGWERALEAVLRERFSALPADQSLLSAALCDPPPASFALALSGAVVAEARVVAPESLRARLICRDPFWLAVLDEWLAGIKVVEQTADLASCHEGVWVSREGHLRTPHGLILYAPEARWHGVIERQREIDELHVEIERHQATEIEAGAAVERCEAELRAAVARLQQARRELDSQRQRLHAAQVEALKLNEAQTRFEEQVARLVAELSDCEAGGEAETLRIMRVEEEVERRLQALEQFRERLDAALERQRCSEAALREAQALERQLAREAQEAQFSERECASKLEDNAHATSTARSQLERIDREQAISDEELAGMAEAPLDEQFQSALARRSENESLLATKRDELENAAAAMRALDEDRLRLEQGLGSARERINELKLAEQAARLNEAQFVTRLQEAGIDEAKENELAALLRPDLKENALSAEIGRLNRAIAALGSVNLAALEELTVAEQRKGFLDAQSEDLRTAIETLENAIRRIDRETREQLLETYETVNRYFGELFPQLFGGGEARLIMTGDEILDAGVQIMAQPPGKKNSTIHLLSGGEKALTAIALVFGMFRLNPAPFCLLDEVDAPLDDSNTERFCALVKRMSAVTQFIFISHNKIAMEMATHLIGVTMQEQGVSRVVEVDIEEAVKMTEREAA